MPTNPPDAATLAQVKAAIEKMPKLSFGDTLSLDCPMLVELWPDTPYDADCRTLSPELAEHIVALVNAAPALVAGCETLEKFRLALTAIAEHPHNNYGHPSHEAGPYGIGTCDGHRCAAKVALAALDAAREE